ncbi:WecB/TagA/CpsF family glycosyltransferase [Persicobacter sp. CCB-QB2]|uniref:WecB/TagA/CpsF family glycosyltransferase n=1 Tax=Persicobacter sp. CCB-QB2 TaxID=1561025 RepID=UPI00092F4960|nr:WecB/TagA/CpsF family glycosyltransferase [Persicobacter sp. CCB-QB2]
MKNTNQIFYTFLNPYSYLLVRKQEWIAKQFDFFIDGEWLCKFFRVFTATKPQRVSFDMTSLAPVVFKEAEERHLSIYLIGSKNDEIAGAVQEFRQAFPRVKIVGFRDGYVKGIEKEVYAEICRVSPDIVIAGMGTPFQEQFLVGLGKFGWKGTGFTCGGFFHQTAKGINYYPKWVDQWNLRWVYRIYDEPKLFWRYFLDYPKFVFVFMYDLLFNRWWKEKILLDIPNEVV